MEATFQISFFLAYVKIEMLRYSKTCLKDRSQKAKKMVFKTNYRLMQVKSIAECSKGSILQYFRPSLSYHLSLRSSLCLFLSGHLRQVLLFIIYYELHVLVIVLYRQWECSKYHC